MGTSDAFLGKSLSPTYTRIFKKTAAVLRFRLHHTIVFVTTRDKIFEKDFM
jgi:hypothetical protein